MFLYRFPVASHLPFLFHIVTLLVSTGPLSLRASTHGLVINIIHSLCTCAQLSFNGMYMQHGDIALSVSVSVSVYSSKQVQEASRAPSTFTNINKTYKFSFFSLE